MNIKLVKKKIKAIPFLGKFLVQIKSSFMPQVSLQFWLRKYLPKGEAYIIQIGSNDGKTGDPIYKLVNERQKWKVVFVEPVPSLFQRLKENYGNNNRFTFENTAINDGLEQIFYSISPQASIDFPELPNWYNQLGSFFKENITNHFNG